MLFTRPHTEDALSSRCTFHSFNKDHSMATALLPGKQSSTYGPVNNEDGCMWYLRLVLVIKSHPQQGGLLQPRLPYVVLFDPLLIGIEWNTCCWQPIKAFFHRQGQMKRSVLLSTSRQKPRPMTDRPTWQGFFYNKCLLHYPVHMFKSYHGCSARRMHYMYQQISVD